MYRPRENAPWLANTLKNLTCVIPHIYDYGSSTKWMTNIMSLSKQIIERPSGIPSGVHDLEVDTVPFRFIDIRTSDFRRFVDFMHPCRQIYSASLHGIIFSDALGIPWKYIRLNAAKAVSQDPFKYEDFFDSVGITGDCRRHFVYNANKTMAALIRVPTCLSNVRNWVLNITNLVKACPFCIGSIQKRVIRYVEKYGLR